MPVRLLCLICASFVLRAQSNEDVRKQIETSYARALAALHESKTIEDLDEINRSLDTRDWVSIAPNRAPWDWEFTRTHPFESLTAPFDSSALVIETLEVQGNTATLTGKLRVVSNGRAMLVPLKETWVKTVIGWKRKVHQKLGPPVPESVSQKPGA